MPLWIVVVSAMAVAVGLVVVAVLVVSDALPSEIVAALKPVERRTSASDETGGLVIVHVDGVPTGVARGIQWGLLALFVGGVPAAIVAAALLRWPSREAQWSQTWGTAFLAGFVFQLGSVVLTTFLLALILWAAYDLASEGPELILPAGLLLVAVATGIWGLRSWRILQLQVEPTPSMIPLGGPANRPLQPTSGAADEGDSKRW
jgi:hypothetical protein